jgi:metal-responsive CopG/Arc/MetJ family transcriptional regulator
MGEAKMIRTNINFPNELFTEGKKYSKKLNISFNKFVREATEEYLNIIKKKQLEQKLAQGYKEKAKLNLKISKEFKHVDGENV